MTLFPKYGESEDRKQKVDFRDGQAPMFTKADDKFWAFTSNNFINHNIWPSISLRKRGSSPKFMKLTFPYMYMYPVIFTTNLNKKMLKICNISTITLIKHIYLTIDAEDS